MDLAGKQALVLGLGASGLSMARWLARHGARVRVADTRQSPPRAAQLARELPDVPVAVGEFRDEDFARAELIAISPGVALSEPPVARAVQRGVSVVGDIELFAQALPGFGHVKVLAITGSNGKSTVTEMAGAMCRAAGVRTIVAGNIGLPALDALSQVEQEQATGGPRPEAFVLELSSFQLETTWSLAPAVAAVLNVSADHMDRYPDLAAYVAAKARILAGAEVAVLNLDDPVVARLGHEAGRVVGFSVQGDPRARARVIPGADGDWLALGGDAVVAAASLPLAGKHNIANVLAAMAMAEVLGIAPEAMARGIAAFRGLAHRCMRIARHAGVSWIDDSKGTNVGATVAAIEGIAQGRNLVLIAGGVGKGQDFHALAAPIARHVHTLVLMGRDAPAIDEVVPAGVTRRHAASMPEAVALAARTARAGDSVLLSPACASFDMFDGYAARGDAFAAAVRALEQT
jgi:UDP-N-acetylmuramoylalanine--D-glutamate ligase